MADEEQKALNVEKQAMYGDRNAVLTIISALRRYRTAAKEILRYKSEKNPIYVDGILERFAAIVSLAEEDMADE